MTRTAYSAEAVRERPLQRAAPHDPQRRTLARIRLSWGAVPMNPEMTKEMKIIQFPVNFDKFPVKFDKFTGFFDKFLKMNDDEIDEIINYISVIYAEYIKVENKYFFEIYRIKKVFSHPAAARISPQLPAGRRKLPREARPPARAGMNGP